MTHPFRCRWTLPCLPLSAGLLAVAAAVHAGSWPASMSGQWEVIQVAVDRADQPHWQYFPDDPRLLGRQLVISGSSISLNDDSRDCLAPASSSLAKNRLDRFVGQQFPRPPAFGTPARPTLRDFDLKLPDSIVSPVRLSCTPGNSPWDGAWLVPLSPDSMLTNYDNSGYMLVLRRRGGTTRPVASFPCGKAHAGAEQAICASAALAGYDRSVTAAYRRALEIADDRATLRQEQLEWLGTRNTCGTDTDCLEKSMRRRVEQLMQ